MPRLIITARAVAGLERCRQFLSRKNNEASRRAADAIRRHFDQLAATPAMGRPVSELPELRELLIPFGDAGYVTLYRTDTANDAIVILPFRHQREAGY
jgi:plasmid stabilization system protein ParE